MSEVKRVKGYKAFKPDWTCRNKQYTCPGKFEEDVKLSLCGSGMHFCKNAADCYDYGYEFTSETKLAEVIAYGKVIEGDDKCCTDKLEIVREIPWNEVLEIVNTGKGCTGCRNSGDYNSGNRNSGYYNSGNHNSGDRNSGNWNSGDRNSGDWNSGDWNKCCYSNGCFNTIEPKIFFFNKPSEWTYRDWINSEACNILNTIPVKNRLNFVWLKDMTDVEKEKHPEAKTTGDYFKEINNSNAVNEWWQNLSNQKKEIIKSIPNFDSEIFKEITGIDVD